VFSLERCSGAAPTFAVRVSDHPAAGRVGQRPGDRHAEVRKSLVVARILRACADCQFEVTLPSRLVLQVPPLKGDAGENTLSRALPVRRTERTVLCSVPLGLQMATAAARLRRLA